MATNSYGKRQASSPRENMSKKPSASFETDPDKLVKIEFDSINGKPYFGQVSDDELLYLWIQVLGRKRDELFGVTSTKTLTRKVRATFRLHNPIKLTEAFESERFEYEKFLDDGSQEVISGKILNYGEARPAKVGDLVHVTVRTNLSIEAAGIVNWLKNYGTLTSKVQDFQTNPTTGLKTDVFEAELVLKTHIEEYLPMYGAKVQVYYPGIPRMCNRCYTPGHIRRDCCRPKKDWIVYVIELLDRGVSPSLIGSWNNAVARFKSQQDPNKAAATSNAASKS
jgi:hypothetical protein